MLSKSDYRYFEKAKKIACVSDFYKVHIGCVAVYQNNIIGIGGLSAGYSYKGSTHFPQIESVVESCTEGTFVGNAVG